MMLVKGKVDYRITARTNTPNCSLSMHGFIQHKSNVKEQTKKNFRAYLPPASLPCSCNDQICVALASPFWGAVFTSSISILDVSSPASILTGSTPAKDITGNQTSVLTTSFSGNPRSKFL